MNTFSLESALETVFFNQYDADMIEKFGNLCNLFSYYREEDAAPEFCSIFNTLQVLLTKIQLLKNVNHHPSIPTNFRCDFDNSENNKGNNTFAPVIKIPKYQPLPDYNEQIEKIMDVLSKLDIASMVDYVKQKAIKAGDFEFEEEE